MMQEKTFTYNDEQQLGQLYILSDIKQGSEEQKSYLANLISSAIRREYYDYPDRKPLDALKASLQKANIIFEKFNQPVNFICAVLHQGKLYLAQTQNNQFLNINQSKLESVEEPISNLPLIQPNPKKPLIALFPKMIISAYIVFAVVLLGSIYYFQNTTQKQNLLDYEKILNQANQKILQAEAVLIFNEYDKAKENLKQAENLIQPLADSSEKQGLDQKIKNQYNKANQLKTVLPEKIDRLPSLLEREYFDINVSEEISIDTAFYSNYVYLLTNNQIYKYQRTLSGIGNKKAWLKQKTDFDNPLSLAIDGDIYVLDDNQIRKFYRGEEQEFTIPLALNQPIKIFASEYNEYLYILEKNKIIILNKSSELIAQYISEQFTNLQNIWVAKKDKKIYVLNNEQILEINIVDN